MSTEAQRRASLKYNKASTKNIQFRLNTKTDADIISFLDTLPNKMGYFKALVRADMEARKNAQGD